MACLIGAPCSGSGKTLLSLCLAAVARRRGLTLQPFKVGPDYLDPQLLSRVSGRPCRNLDPLLCGDGWVERSFAWHGSSADQVLVEGVMGLFDGRPSTADIARTLGIPVLASISGAAMAQTFGAIAHGLSTFRPDVPFAGVFANRVSSEGHYRMLLEDLPPGLTALGYLPKAPDAALPSRHLGLVQAEEIQDLDQRLEAAAGRLVWTAGGLPPPVSFAPVDRSPPPRLLAGRRIAVARDAAFAFIYPANLEVLAKLGATLCFFSPVAGERLPEADGVYLPGGYPELHLPALAANERLKQDLLSHISAGRPILAECGGMLYLLERLSDVAGQEADMAGLLPGEARMQGRLAGLGPQEVVLPEGTLRGHTFHHSAMTARIEPLTHACSPNGRATAEPVYRLGPVTASYVHLYFPSNPEAIGHLLGGHRPC